MIPGDSEARSIGQLLRDLADDVTRLIRTELALARSEAGDKISHMTTALVSIAAGALLGLAALMVILDALVLWLSNHMPDWLSALIVAGVVGLVGFMLVYRGQKELAAGKLAPTRTVENVRKDLNMVKEQVS